MVNIPEIDTVLKQAIIEPIESVINNITTANEKINDIVGELKHH